MEMFARNRKLGFTYSIDADVPVYARTASERLRQVLINLISNAVKFTPDGSIELGVKLSDGKGYDVSGCTGGYIEFYVKDTGIGIPEEKLDKIFESFTQGDESTFRKYGGTGLGLTISRQLIRLMSGDIKVESIAGKGSTFRFIIPVIPGNRPVEEIAGIVMADEKHGHKRILIAEDNLLNQKLITAFMKKTGYDFELVENGADAIDRIKHDRFDVVLMDLEMPVMNGRESLDRIRSGEAGEDNRNIPVYAMSAHVLSETIYSCISAGFSGYITKPLDLKKISDILR